jgi:hypothetical protein
MQFIEHPNYSYNSFAAGASAYGIRAAASAAQCYGVPLLVCLHYLRRYSRFGYVV